MKELEDQTPYPDNPPWTMFFDGPLYEKYREFMANKDFSQILLTTKLKMANQPSPVPMVPGIDGNMGWWTPDQDKPDNQFVGDEYNSVSDDFYRKSSRGKKEEKRRTRRTRAILLLIVLVLLIVSLGTALIIHYFVIPHDQSESPAQVNISFSGNTSIFDMTTALILEDIEASLDDLLETIRTDTRDKEVRVKSADRPPKSNISTPTVTPTTDSDDVATTSVSNYESTSTTQKKVAETKPIDPMDFFAMDENFTTTPVPPTTTTAGKNATVNDTTVSSTRTVSTPDSTESVNSPLSIPTTSSEPGHVTGRASSRLRSFVTGVSTNTVPVATTSESRFINDSGTTPNTRVTSKLASQTTMQKASPTTTATTAFTEDWLETTTESFTAPATSSSSPRPSDETEKETNHSSGLALTELSTKQTTPMKDANNTTRRTNNPTLTSFEKTTISQKGTTTSAIQTEEAPEVITGGPMGTDSSMHIVINSNILASPSDFATTSLRPNTTSVEIVEMATETSVLSPAPSQPPTASEVVMSKITPRVTTKVPVSTAADGTSTLTSTPFVSSSTTALDTSSTASTSQPTISTSTAQRPSSSTSHAPSLTSITTASLTKEPPSTLAITTTQTTTPTPGTTTDVPPRVTMKGATTYKSETARITCRVTDLGTFESLSIREDKRFDVVKVTVNDDANVEWTYSKTHRHDVAFEFKNVTGSHLKELNLTMLIKDVQCKDEGRFICVLKTRASHYTRRAKLFVVGRPDDKIELQIGPSVVENKAVRLTAIWQGGYPIPWTNMSWTALDSNNNTYDLTDYGEYKDYELRVDHQRCRTSLKWSIVIFPKVHLNDTTVMVKPDLVTTRSFLDHKMKDYLKTVEYGVQKILVIPLNYCQNSTKEVSIPHPYTECTKFVWCLPGNLVVQQCPVGTCFYKEWEECM